MSYFEVFTSQGAKVIDDTYQNIKFTRKVAFSDLPDAGNITGYTDPANSFAVGTLKTKQLIRDPGELPFAAIGPLAKVLGKVQVVWRTDLGAAYLAYPDGYDITGIDVFLFSKDQKPEKKNYGIEIYDSQSNLIFTSAYKYFKPLAVTWGSNLAQIVGDESKADVIAAIYPLKMDNDTSSIQLYFYTAGTINFPCGYIAGHGSLVMPNFRRMYAPLITCDCTCF